MYSINIVASTRQVGESLEYAVWAPVMPSFQDPTIEWATGEKLAVAAVEFPTWRYDNPRDNIVVTAAGVLLDAERQRFLDRGWRVRP